MTIRYDILYDYSRRVNVDFNELCSVVRVATNQLQELPEPKQPDTCPLPTYDCKCRGNWCRLLGRNLQ